MGSSPEPYSDFCTNPDSIDRWTCPGCYRELGNVGDGKQIACPECNRTVRCTIAWTPNCVSRLVEPDDKEGGGQ